jgi:predicted fused transcriptional regulator/phosphomethylpyrimidine kinase
VHAHKHKRDVEEVKTLAGRLLAAMEQDKYMVRTAPKPSTQLANSTL